MSSARPASGSVDLMADPRLRLVGTAITALVLIEGAADVMIVVVALELLGLGEGSVGWLNAAWAIGALLAGVGLGVLVHRGNLAGGLTLGCLITGVGFALPGIWPVVPAAYPPTSWSGSATPASRSPRGRSSCASAPTSRWPGSSPSSRRPGSAATALGAIIAPALVVLLGARGALLVFGAILPAIVALPLVRVPRARDRRPGLGAELQPPPRQRDLHPAADPHARVALPLAGRGRCRDRRGGRSPRARTATAST